MRPICFETNPDGSTKRMFVQVTNLHGFAIVDWDTRKEVGRITLPDLPPGRAQQRRHPGRARARHPDRAGWQDALVDEQVQQPVYAYSMPDLKYLGDVKVGKVPDWLTFTPDSKKLYVANAHENFVSVVDVAARKEIAQIKVGQVPKRNITAILPALPATTDRRSELVGSRSVGSIWSGPSRGRSPYLQVLGLASFFGSFLGVSRPCWPDASRADSASRPSVSAEDQKVFFDLSDLDCRLRTRVTRNR